MMGFWFNIIANYLIAMTFSYLSTQIRGIRMKTPKPLISIKYSPIFTF
jgi:hypothetical protein